MQAKHLLSTLAVASALALALPAMAQQTPNDTSQAPTTSQSAPTSMQSQMPSADQAQGMKQPQGMEQQQGMKQQQKSEQSAGMEQRHHGRHARHMQRRGNEMTGRTYGNGVPAGAYGMDVAPGGGRYTRSDVAAEEPGRMSRPVVGEPRAPSNVAQGSLAQVDSAENAETARLNREQLNGAGQTAQLPPPQPGAPMNNQ